MAGDIWFLQHHWSGSSHAVQYVMEFVADRVRDAHIRDELREMAEANVAFLDLSDPEQSELVNIIAEELPEHVAALDDTQLRDNLTDIFASLYRYAREQQNFINDPTQDRYFPIGPNPAKHFELENLMRRVQDHLRTVDYVRIDVSDYSAEQRAMVSDYVAEAANPRILVIGDEPGGQSDAG